MLQKMKKYGIVIGRTVTLYFSFVLISFVAWSLLQTPAFQKNVEGFWNDILYFQVIYVYSLLIFFSLSSVFQLHNSKLKQYFYTDHMGTSSVLHNCGLILKSPQFWIESASLWGCTLLFSALPPIVFFRKGFLNGVSASKQVIPIVVSLLLLQLLYFGAYLSTLNWWGQRSRKYFEEEHPLRRFLTQLSYTAVLWMLGGFLLAIMYPLLSGFFKAFYRYLGAILISLAVLLLILVLIRYGSVLIYRSRLIRGIRLVCKRNKFIFFAKGHPYLGILFPEVDCEITIKNSTDQCTCHFIAGLQKKNPLYLREDGFAEYSRFRIWWSHVTVEPFQFDVDDDFKKILIICPCQGMVLAKDGSAERQLESGDRMLDYKVYQNFDFINALERGYL